MYVDPDEKVMYYRIGCLFTEGQLHLFPDKYSMHTLVNVKNRVH